MEVSKENGVYFKLTIPSIQTRKAFTQHTAATDIIASSEQRRVRLFNIFVVTGHEPNSSFNHNHHHPLPSMLAASRLTIRGIVTVAGQRAAVQTIKRVARGVQSVAQTDRVC